MRHTCETIARWARGRRERESWLICNISSTCTYVRINIGSTTLFACAHHVRLLQLQQSVEQLLTTQFPIRSCQCKWEWNCGRVGKGVVTLGDELAGHKSSGRKLVLCPSPLLPLTACAGHMWRASHVRYSRWGREGEGEGEGDPPEARWADCGWVNK